jgi:7-cyano-7-deazaguanine synthase in queuosine biosynthesis
VNRQAIDGPLAPLCVIDRLEVGPVSLEPRRLAMPYVVVAGGGRTETRLLCRFEEEVFDPSARADFNLASLTGAQVALNYGLFCREIVFRGPFDPIDRRFLASMAENTAREIYVKKFLEPNPFLVGEATQMPAVRQPEYSNAELRFPDAVQVPVRSPVWTSDVSGFGVLSSGGKDSLLSLGLLEELGYEPHSLFVNESGRHWYTALNAHRYLARTRPNRTARVWTTSDRVFAWMLRQLPFVRSDFARLRSDEYPIRLWTVGVFLFGALAVARKRRLGRVVIGDEYDTTERKEHAGIPHYDGLYDQSRYFDEAMTRYYRRKGWPLVQFSLLRSMSELLIQKTLVERYPELQSQQLSCHAAHLEKGRVKPCGRCEKCRRIVSMLSAFGADPAACGYTANQIEDCLDALVDKAVHQEAVAARHVLWLLDRRGRLPDRARNRGKELPEVLNLRFHEDRAPPGYLPDDLRAPLLRLLLENASGALIRRGRSWESITAESLDRIGREARRVRPSRTARAPEPTTDPNLD